MAVQRLQLLVFYYKHLKRTQLQFEHDLATVKNISDLKDQKALEMDWTKQNPEHKLEPMQLDAQQAAQAFDQATTILRRIRGVTGVPLAYVVRHRIIPDFEDKDRPMVYRDSRFTTHDKEMEARAPIIDVEEYDGYAEGEDLEKHGPFSASFLSDTRKVWSVLHSLWSTTSAWAHVKTLDKTQNGRQVYRTLHKHFFGGNKILTLSTNILTTLRGLTYTGDSKNYNFDKYVTNHVQQHNLATSLIDYGATELDEHLKINYFLTGIQSSDFDAAKASISANPERFTDFDTVKDHFLEIRRLQQASKPAATSRVSAVTGRGGGRTPNPGRGGGGRTNGRERKSGSHDAQKAGLPTQAEVNKQTHIKARRYSKEEYKKFTPAEKQRHWQLMNPDAKPGTDTAKRTVSAVRSNNDDSSEDNKSLFPDSSDDDKKSGGNRDNPALKRQKK
jgi:hypothetical protein